MILIRKKREVSVTAVDGSLYWLALILTCGSFGFFPFAAFYSFVLGSDCLDKVIGGMLPLFIVGLVSVTFLEVASQWWQKRSMMRDTRVAILVCATLAFAASTTMYFMPGFTHFDQISGLMGLEGRDPTALVCDLSAGSLAVIGGIYGFVLTRCVFRRAGIVN